MGGNCPRVLVAGLAGDSGKTLISLALLAASRERGLRVAPFKKGPDYIDAAWLTWAAERRCRNLDSFMVDREVLTARFAQASARADLAVIEGNRGLFDGQDAKGTHSSAGLARLLGAPVVLVVDATKATRTRAALVKGCMAFEPGLTIGGVILNRVAGTRHETITRQAIETDCEVPVLGAVPKDGARAALIPQRHLGLTPPTELDECDSIRNRLLDLASSSLDIDALIRLATTAPPVAAELLPVHSKSSADVTIGYFTDRVFTFYYPENLEALETAGARLEPISSITDTSLPVLDGLYIGGGFPETNIEALATNRTLMADVKRAAEAGLPIYAECGGLIYLCRSLSDEQGSHRMAGVFDLDLALQARPAGHGYMIARVDRANPFFEVGSQLRGHEFHYSMPTNGVGNEDTCLLVSKGAGVHDSRDGLLKKRCFAAYLHLHADAIPGWAARFVAQARAWKRERRDNNDARPPVSERKPGFEAHCP